MRTSCKFSMVSAVIVAACLMSSHVLAEDRTEDRSQWLNLEAHKWEVLDPDFRPKGAEPQYYLPKGGEHVTVSPGAGEQLFLWGPDMDLGPANGVGMSVVPAGPNAGDIFAGRLRVVGGTGNSDSIRVYRSTDGGSSFPLWGTLYSTSGWDLNDFSISAGRDVLCWFFHITNRTDRAYVQVLLVAFDWSWSAFFAVDSTTEHGYEMHPDCASDAEDYASVWYYLAYSLPNTGYDLAFKAIDQGGGLHNSCFLDGALSSKRYWEPDVCYGGGDRVYVAYEVWDDGLARARFSPDLGANWTGKMDISTDGDDSQARVAGRDQCACVVTEDASQGVECRFTTNFGSSWFTSFYPCMAGDLTPAVEAIGAMQKYIPYYSDEGQEATKCWMYFDQVGWRDHLAIGDVRAPIREYSHCYEIRYLWNAGSPLVGVIWIDRRSGSNHAYYDQGLAVGTQEASLAAPSSPFGLSQNRPNPARAWTQIGYALPHRADVSLDVFDVSGRQVKHVVGGPQSEGVHSASWDLRDERNKRLSSGVYFYRLTAGDFTSSKKMVVVR